MKKYRIVLIKCSSVAINAEQVTLTYTHKRTHIPIQIFPVVSDGLSPFDINLVTIQSMAVVKYTSRHPAPVINTDILDLTNIERPGGLYSLRAIDQRQDIPTDYYLLAYESLMST